VVTADLKMNLAKKTLPFYFPQDLNMLQASVFQKLLAKYCGGKS
jgi:hypothetical protein